MCVRAHTRQLAQLQKKERPFHLCLFGNVHVLVSNQAQIRSDVAQMQVQQQAPAPEPIAQPGAPVEKMEEPQQPSMETEPHVAKQNASNFVPVNREAPAARYGI